MVDLGGGKLFKFPLAFHFSYLTLSYSSGHSSSPKFFWLFDSSNNLGGSNGPNNCSDCSNDSSSNLETLLTILVESLVIVMFWLVVEPYDYAHSLARAHPLLYPS